MDPTAILASLMFDRVSPVTPGILQPNGDVTNDRQPVNWPTISAARDAHHAPFVRLSRPAQLEISLGRSRGQSCPRPLAIEMHAHSIRRGGGTDNLACSFKALALELLPPKSQGS